MFGNLFDEEEEFICQPVKKSVSIPHPRRPSSGLCGLKNQGATCYLNSLLQILLYTPEFRDALFKLKPQRATEKTNVIIIELQYLFGKLLLLNQNAISTEDLTDSFGWNNKEVCEQHDIQELLRILLSVLEKSLQDTPNKSIFSSLYHGLIRYEIICKNCQITSRICEDFMELHVHVIHNASLEEALFKNFQVVEILKNNNSYFCENCCSLVEARKTAKLRSLPPIMTINLLRFNFDRKAKERYKETGHFRFPVHLKLLQYCSEEVPPEDANYELISVVVHKGNPYNGHYHAYIRDVDGWGKWTNPHKSRHRPVPIKNPLPLIVSLFSKSDHNPVPIKDIEKLLVKHAKISWQEQYEDTFGSLLTFIKRYDIFFYDTLHKTVSLLYKVPDTNMATTPDDDDIFTLGECMNTYKVYHQPETGRAWFDFNDETIKPIMEKDLDRTFQGEESAYMLFYRQTKRIFPLQAAGNPAYGIPDHVMQCVFEETDKLENWREEYAESINQISIELLLSSNYEYQDGALRIKEEVDKLSVITDKRDTFNMFLQKIQKICETNSINVPDPLHLHFISHVPAGIHLMDRFYEDDLQILMFTELKNKSKLFCWDGEMIGGKKEMILVGPESQPLLLNIIIAKCGEVSQEFSYGLAKNTTVMELKNKLLTYLEIDASSLKLSWITRQVFVKMLEFEDYTHEKTLADLKIGDGDQIIVEENTSNYAQELFNRLLEEETRKITLCIQNRCETSSESTWDWPEKMLILDKDQTIDELKMQIISKLDIAVPSCGGRLRIDVDTTGLQPPLHGHLMIEEACLYNGTRVVLEPGPSPNSDEISITILAKERKHIDLIINHNYSVDESLRIILNKAELQGQNWMLRKVNWYGEPGNYLDDSKSTLKQFGIKNGDQLLIEDQALPSKDIISPAIWLYPRLYIGHHLLPIIHYVDYNESQVNPENHEPVFLGNLDMYSGNTVSDFKKHLVKSCRQLSSVKNISYLRLSLIENERPARILRDDSQSLRKLKITNSTHLACQILNSEENLRVDHTLLFLCEYLSESKDYKLPREFLWDCSSAPSFSNLRKAIYKFLHISTDQLIFAKYLPEKRVWQDIQDQKEEMKKDSSHLRPSTYLLKDGDIIGFKYENSWTALDNVPAHKNSSNWNTHNTNEELSDETPNLLTNTVKTSNIEKSLTIYLNPQR